MSHQARVRKLSTPIKLQLSLRARARQLFPNWPRHLQAEWVVKTMKVKHKGTWKFPLGESYVSNDVPEFLRVLPPGPRLEVIESCFDKRRKIQRKVGMS